MKKQGILNSHIAEVLARLGHTDTIVIADCGLPIPDHVQRIDIALKQGTPSFMETLMEVAEDMAIETMTFAEEIKTQNGRLLQSIQQELPDTEIQFTDHEALKLAVQQAKAVIRTGEATPYANVILKAGVIF